MSRQIMNVKDVAAVLEVSESKSYAIIRALNKELSDKGYITIQGKIPKTYFEEKLYGMHITE